MSNSNPRVLNIAGHSTNELYTVNVPSNLLNFCNYNFTHFMEDCGDLCRRCMKSGEYPTNEINIIRNSIVGCHKYFESNSRSIFDKIVIDCWIEEICRQGEIGTTTLWNSFMDCKNPFQKAVFQRLSEYRSHRAINQWVNLLKMQEYAKKKLDFVFGCKLSSVNEAALRLNIFDLMFSVAANEQGYSLDAIGSVKVFKAGRLSNAPFVFSGASKEIIRNLFKNVHFADSLPYAGRYESCMSDWEAMDSFAVIKNHLPDHDDNVANTIIKSMSKMPQTVYMPSSFKAMIDLEIDTIINSGAFLQRCGRCREYYVRDDYYTSEYCDTVQKNGTTCREIMEKTGAAAISAEDLTALKEKSDMIYREMSSKVGTDITQRDFSEWLNYFNVVKSNVQNGTASFYDFEQFIDYSRNYAFPKAVIHQPEEIRTEASQEEGQAVKPYQFARVDRKELEQQGLLKRQTKTEEETAAEAVPAAVIPPKPSVAKIIRGAHPTSFQEIPVQSDVNIPAQSKQTERSEFKEETITAAEKAGASARAAIKSDLSRLEKEKEEHNTHSLPDLDDFPAPDKEDKSLENVKETAAREEEASHKPPKLTLPDFNDEMWEIKQDLKPQEPRAEAAVESSMFKALDEPETSEAKAQEFTASSGFVRRAPEMNRAARVVSAYKTVTDMPQPDIKEKNQNDGEDALDNFAKILDNIERNDGFDDEEVPTDADGIPLSHKTKHVMDAIMKNTRISPSLIYGRRQAAEQNVVIDESFMNKNGSGGAAM